MMRCNPISLRETQEQSVLKPLNRPVEQVCRQVTRRDQTAGGWEKNRRVSAFAPSTEVLTG